jgi:hypothetical protein
MVEFSVWQILWNLLLAARWTVLMTTWARSAHRPRGAQARSLRSGRAYAGLVGTAAISTRHTCHG